MLQELRKERYRFRIVVQELKNTQYASYRATLLAFVNCVIKRTAGTKERATVRNEFIGESRVRIRLGDHDRAEECWSWCGVGKKNVTVA